MNTARRRRRRRQPSVGALSTRISSFRTALRRLSSATCTHSEARQLSGLTQTHTACRTHSAALPRSCRRRSSPAYQIQHLRRTIRMLTPKNPIPLSLLLGSSTQPPPRLPRSRPQEMHSKRERPERSATECARSKLRKSSADRIRRAATWQIRPSLLP